MIIASVGWCPTLVAWHFDHTHAQLVRRAVRGAGPCPTAARPTTATVTGGTARVARARGPGTAVRTRGEEIRRRAETLFGGEPVVRGGRPARRAPSWARTGGALAGAKGSVPSLPRRRVVVVDRQGTAGHALLTRPRAGGARRREATVERTLELRRLPDRTGTRPAAGSGGAGAARPGRFLGVGPGVTSRPPIPCACLRRVLAVTRPVLRTRRSRRRPTGCLSRGRRQGLPLGVGAPRCGNGCRCGCRPGAGWSGAVSWRSRRCSCSPWCSPCSTSGPGAPSR